VILYAFPKGCNVPFIHYLLYHIVSAISSKYSPKCIFPFHCKTKTGALQNCLQRAGNLHLLSLWGIYARGNLFPRCHCEEAKLLRCFDFNVGTPVLGCPQNRTLLGRTPEDGCPYKLSLRGHLCLWCNLHHRNKSQSRTTIQPVDEHREAGAGAPKPWETPFFPFTPQKAQFAPASFCKMEFVL